jgi:single-strand DNA-binding protein
LSGETEITIVGNAVDDPELRFTPSGVAVAKFRVASTPRTFDRQTNEWKDGESLFLTVNVWRQPAEHVAETITRGMRVIVQGRLNQRSYETKEGEKRTVFEIEANEVGPSLRSATAKVTKASRQGGQQQEQHRPQQAQQQSQDPWASNTQQRPQQGAWGAPVAEPPF